MPAKKFIKESESRIIIYLSVVHNTLKHVTAISGKLQMDYAYCMRVLQAMVAKKWLYKHQYRRHMFYDLLPAAPLNAAKAFFTSDNLQTFLKDYAYLSPEPDSYPPKPESNDPAIPQFLEVPESVPECPNNPFIANGEGMPGDHNKDIYSDNERENPSPDEDPTITDDEEDMMR